MRAPGSESCRECVLKGVIEETTARRERLLYGGRSLADPSWEYHCHEHSETIQISREELTCYTLKDKILSSSKTWSHRYRTVPRQATLPRARTIPALPLMFPSRSMCSAFAQSLHNVDAYDRDGRYCCCGATSALARPRYPWCHSCPVHISWRPCI